MFFKILSILGIFFTVATFAAEINIPALLNATHYATTNAAKVNIEMAKNFENFNSNSVQQTLKILPSNFAHIYNGFEYDKNVLQENCNILAEYKNQKNANTISIPDNLFNSLQNMMNQSVIDLGQIISTTGQILSTVMSNIKSYTISDHSFQIPESVAHAVINNKLVLVNNFKALSQTSQAKQFIMKRIATYVAPISPTDAAGFDKIAAANQIYAEAFNQIAEYCQIIYDGYQRLNKNDSNGIVTIPTNEFFNIFNTQMQNIGKAFDNRGARLIATNSLSSN